MDVMGLSLQETSILSDYLIVCDLGLVYSTMVRLTNQDADTHASVGIN